MSSEFIKDRHQRALEFASLVGRSRYAEEDLAQLRTILSLYKAGKLRESDFNEWLDVVRYAARFYPKGV